MRKSNQTLVTCTRKRPRKIEQIPIWLKHSTYKCLQLKTRMLGVVIRGPQRGGQQFMWRWTNRHLVNTCLLGQAETKGHRSLRAPPPHLVRNLHRYLWGSIYSGNRPFYQNSLRQVQGGQFLPESLGLCFQSEIVCLPRDILGWQILLPTVVIPCRAGASFSRRLFIL